MLKKFLPIIILVIVVVGAGSFYGGMVYGKSSSKGSLARDFNPEQFGANITGMGQRGGRVNGTGTVGAGGGFVSGEVMNQDEQSITLKLQDAGTKIIFFSSSTQVTKTQEGSTSNISVGENLTVTGKINADGSITAQSIQIRPISPMIGK